MQGEPEKTGLSPDELAIQRWIDDGGLVVAEDAAEDAPTSEAEVQVSETDGV